MKLPVICKNLFCVGEGFPIISAEGYFIFGVSLIKNKSPQPIYWVDISRQIIPL